MRGVVRKIRLWDPVPPKARALLDRIHGCSLALLITASLGCVGCEAPVRPRHEQRRADKRSLFADASLVPTREGERVRRELALAGELTTSLELMALGPVHVDLELHAGLTSAAVIAQLPGDADAAQVEADVVELVAAVVPELEPAQIHVWLRPGPNTELVTPPRDRYQHQSRALMLVCLGLGLSLGVTLERARARRTTQR